MARRMKLKASTLRALLNAHQALTADVEMLREDWDDRSDTWQDSDRGTDADNWLSELEGAADTLGEIPLEPDGDTVEDCL